MTIDEAGHQELAPAVDHFHDLRAQPQSEGLRLDAGDPAVRDEHVLDTQGLGSEAPPHLR